ncbi:MAG: hypothetical protein U9O41_02260, partial [Candidatus Aerophobetes bacterium]|nr:hypothetical protein [Candidatus Aerophobetes bacterium]
RNGYDTVNNQEHYNKVHEIANRVPLTQKSNMEVFDKEPSVYLPVVEKMNPSNLRRFFIPMNEALWKVENFGEFLDKRRKLLVEGINSFMDDLLEK